MKTSIAISVFCLTVAAVATRLLADIVVGAPYGWVVAIIIAALWAVAIVCLGYTIVDWTRLRKEKKSLQRPNSFYDAETYR